MHQVGNQYIVVVVVVVDDDDKVCFYVRKTLHVLRNVCLNTLSGTLSELTLTLEALFRLKYECAVFVTRAADSVYSSRGFLTSALARLLTTWVCRQQDVKCLTAVCVLEFLPLCRKCLPQQRCVPLFISFPYLGYPVPYQAFEV